LIPASFPGFAHHLDDRIDYMRIFTHEERA
jgi:hypothetical protein